MRLAAVVIEKYAWRAVHLRDNHPFGTIHDKGTVGCHQRHVAHIDILLLDVADGPRTGHFVLFPHLKAQGHFQRRRIGQAALLAFLDIIFRCFQIIGYEFQLCAAGKILDRENRLEGFLEAMVVTRMRGDVHLQESVIAGALHIDQVRHSRHFGKLSECPAYTPATVESANLRCHQGYLVS